MDDQMEETRFVVDNDMRMEPTPLSLDWAQFVWLALGLGADPYFGFQDTLRNTEGRPIATLTSSRGEGICTVKLLPGWYEYSLRNALASVSIMMSDTLELSFSKDQESVDLCSVRRIRSTGFYGAPPAHPSDLILPRNVRLTLKSMEGIVDKEIFAGTSIAKTKNPLATAATWATYTKRCKATGESITVTQELLEMRERSCLFVLQLGDSGSRDRLASFGFEPGVLDCVSKLPASAAIIGHQRPTAGAVDGLEAQLARLDKEKVRDRFEAETSTASTNGKPVLDPASDNFESADLAAHSLLVLSDWHTQARLEWPVDRSIVTEAEHFFESLDDFVAFKSKAKDHETLQKDFDELLSHVSRGLFRAPLSPVYDILRSRSLDKVYLL
ncbi:unnamed protein product [Zymoseptoria tritici ST99CH_3D1]|uniref:Uncharacterized protein n=1 Tax=Zymoseptoria tritici ST99CH_1E4 TaxID=1276532 RepID=A0A2H1GGB4_ZYMTR|nr:unnamed protein product [Zymoseptoria tritici ST99CH_1E4]SMR53796.1 unnamed protein product [Zymoseptoria tritici ST99CH_3D1]